MAVREIINREGKVWTRGGTKLLLAKSYGQRVRSAARVPCLSRLENYFDALNDKLVKYSAASIDADGGLRFCPTKIDHAECITGFVY